MDISVAITTYNETIYLDRLLEDLSKQNCILKFEIIVVEAGNYDVDRAKNYLGRYAENLVFHHFPGLSRTKSLNFIFEAAKGDLIVRLDARSHVNSDYLMDIYKVSIETGAENVGGVMNPVGSNKYQGFIAEIMKNPLAFGGAKARKLDFRGYADSVYLGAFRKKDCKYGLEWFDSIHPKISEDSDLNYRIRQNGGKVFVDSNIVVDHYPRENLSKFFQLCYNYGVGRGLFMIKHGIFSAFRQLIPPLSFLMFVFLLITARYYPSAYVYLFGLFIFYMIIVMTVSVKMSKSARQFIASFLGFIGCHFFWTFGLLSSPFVFVKDIRNAS